MQSESEDQVGSMPRSITHCGDSAVEIMSKSSLDDYALVGESESD